MENYIFKNFKTTIGYFIFKKILLSYLIIVALLTSYQIYNELDSTKNNLSEEYTRITKQFNNELSIAISLKDFEKIDSISKIILELEIKNGIKGIALINDEGKIIIKNGIVDENLKNTQSISNIKSNFEYNNNLIPFKYEIINSVEKNNPIIAQLILYTDKFTITSIAFDSIFLILFNIIISTLALWILIVFTTNKYLTQPLGKLIAGIKSFESHEDEKVAIKLQIENMQELTILANSFNKMSSKISEDIINLKQLTMIQNQQKKALLEANKTKDDFLANMSHELKTPLNSINLISSIMIKNKENKFGEKEIKNLKIINNCGNDLLFLINDILDLSKLEAGKMKLNNEIFNIKEMFQDVVDMFYPQIKDKNLSLNFQCDESLKDFYGDKSRLGQIIKNILGNAIKFTHKGEISLIAENLNDKIKILISDEGIGISEDKLEHIFDRFKQADGSTTRKYGGTGLGLAICKDLINLFEGTIEINSKVNVGTTITIIVPKNLDNVDKCDINKVKKTTPLEKLDHEFLFEEVEVVEEEEGKANILILNSDPIRFMGLIIELNKFCHVYQTSNFKDLTKKMEEESFDLVIIDNDSLSEKDVDKILNLETKFMLTAKKDSIINPNIKIKSEAVIDKPFDNKKAIEVVKFSLE